MAKIAVELERAVADRRRNGAPGGMASRIVARSDDWMIADVTCTSGPQDRPFEERHTRHTIAIVLAGSFQYRSTLGRALMTPGSLMLGNQGQCFECGHAHAEGDRCLSFWYAPDYFDRLASDAGVRGARRGFTAAHLPPLRPLSSVVARAAAGTTGSSDLSWEALGVQLAVQTLRLATGVSSDRTSLPLNAEAGVTRIVRRIERHPDGALTLQALAREARLSPYHFLRTFERVTGVTPHQFVLRTRLRQAATRLLEDADKIVDVALDCGFGDISNFNRAFRSEFRMSPREYRRRLR